MRTWLGVVMVLALVVAGAGEASASCNCDSNATPYDRCELRSGPCPGDASLAGQDAGAFCGQRCCEWCHGEGHPLCEVCEGGVHQLDSGLFPPDAASEPGAGDGNGCGCRVGGRAAC